MILADHEIRSLCWGASIDGVPIREPMISPFDSAQLQPSSYDVTLGDELLMWNLDQFDHVIDPLDPETYQMDSVIGWDGYLLDPGQFVLASTAETVRIPDTVAARVEGKSSLGRLGQLVHITAGYIDPGFHGRITLEVVNLSGRRFHLRPGMRIAQLTFHRMHSPPEKPYSGRYQNQQGVTGSLYVDRRSMMHTLTAED